MHLVSKVQPRAAYTPWLQQLVDYSEPVEVRGHKTLELLNCVTEISNPGDHCILLPSRRWNPFLALSEALWILAGRDDIAALLPYNSHIGDYSDDGNVLYGAYGKRIYHQIDPLIERLKKDPSDRRAVLQIWDNAGPRYGNDLWYNDLDTISKDPPCNNMVYFKLRQGKLHMTVINRSNDLHFGLFAVNLPTFGILQSYIAARLGVDMGTQTHFSNSLHIYTDEPRAAEITDRMMYREPEDMPVYPEHKGFFDDPDFFSSMNEWSGPKHENFAKMCGQILDGTFLGSGAPECFYFAKHFLKMYREHDDNWDSLIGYGFDDWVLAGDLFTSKIWKKSRAV